MKSKTLTIVLLSFALLSCTEHRFDPRAIELNNQALELLVVMDERSQL